MAVEARIPLESDILELIEKLSLDDRKELLVQGVDPEWAIRHSVEHSSECVAVFVGKELVCFTGIKVDDDLAFQAVPWLLGTELMKSYPRHVMRFSRLLVSRWKKLYPFMVNYVDVRHERACRWLSALGATASFLPEYGPYKKPFYRFTFGVDPCASL